MVSLILCYFWLFWMLFIDVFAVVIAAVAAVVIVVVAGVITVAEVFHDSMMCVFFHINIQMLMVVWK